VRPIVFIIREPGAQERVVTYEANELRIGTDPGADLRVNHPSVSADLNAKIRRQEGELILTCYASRTAPIKVNDIGINVRSIVHGDRIRIGDIELIVVSDLKLDPREQALIDDIEANPFDETLRSVYADWLEENGFRDRADYLRLDSEIYIALQGAWKIKIREDIATLSGLAKSLPPAWLALMRRKPKNLFAKPERTTKK
jgi:uncharacterized protein (TIGR02996 family)